MKLLIRKDLYAQPLSAFLVSGLWFIILTNFFTNGDPARHVMLLIAVAYFISISSSANNKSYEKEMVLVNSLPVTRKQVVMAKYASGFVWFLLSAAGILLYIFLFQMFAPFPARMMTVPELLIALGSFFLLLALFYPLQYKAGYVLASALTIIIPIIALMSITIIGNIMDNPRMTQEHLLFQSIAQIYSDHQWLIVLGLLLLSAILTWLSMLLSIRIYRKKDFDTA